MWALLFFNNSTINTLSKAFARRRVFSGPGQMLFFRQFLYPFILFLFRFYVFFWSANRHCNNYYALEQLSHNLTNSTRIICSKYTFITRGFRLVVTSQLSKNHPQNYKEHFASDTSRELKLSLLYLYIPTEANFDSSNVTLKTLFDLLLMLKLSKNHP